MSPSRWKDVASLKKYKRNGFEVGLQGEEFLVNAEEF